MKRNVRKGIYRVFLAMTMLIAWGGLPAQALKFRFVAAVYTDESGTTLKVPEGVACGDASSFIAADTGNGRLVRFRFQEDRLEAETEVLKVSPLSYPEKIMINSSDEIFVFDRRQRRIVQSTPDGKLLGYLEPVGIPPPTTWVPRGFALDGNDAIYVLDVRSERVLVLNPQARYRAQLPFPEGHRFISDLVVDFKGTILILDGPGARVYTAAKESGRFAPLTENLHEYVRYPSRMTVDDRGRIYLSDRNGGAIVVLGQDGSFLGRISARGRKEGLLNYPAQICIGPQGRLFVADTRNNRIQIFELLD